MQRTGYAKDRQSENDRSTVQVGRSATVFALYPLLTGIGFLLAPGPILALVHMPATNNVYPQGIGALLIAVAAYYYVAGRRVLVPFIQASVFGRAFFAICLVVLVLLAPGRQALLLFAALDTAGLLWSAVALRQAGLSLIPDLS